MILVCQFISPAHFSLINENASKEREEDLVWLVLDTGSCYFESVACLFFYTHSIRKCSLHRHAAAAASSETSSSIFPVWARTIIQLLHKEKERQQHPTIWIKENETEIILSQLSIGNNWDEVLFFYFFLSFLWIFLCACVHWMMPLLMHIPYMWCFCDFGDSNS